jgi:hypothetical protein
MPIKYIEYFYDQGNEMDGARKDYYYAICRAQEASEIAKEKEGYDVSGDKGFTLHFEPKEYYFSKPIELVRCMHLLGDGGTYSGTIFTFPQDSPGIIVHSNSSYKNPLYVDIAKMGDYVFQNRPGEAYPFAGATITLEDDGKPITLRENYQSATLSIIENIQIRCSTPPSKLIGGNVELIYNIEYGAAIATNLHETAYSPDMRPHGITSFVPVYIRNVVIDNFNCHGVYLYGHAGARPSGSKTGDSAPLSGRKQVAAIVDFSVVENSTISHCGGDAIHLFGSDAAYCKIGNILDSANGGWTVTDFSRIGNIILGCNSNAETKTKLNADGSIKSFVGGAYLRPYQIEQSLLDDDNYIKEKIQLWYRNVIDDAGNIIDLVRYNAYVAEAKSLRIITGLSETTFLNSYAEGGTFSYIAAGNLVLAGNIQNFGNSGKIYGQQTLLFPNGLTAYGFQYLSNPLEDRPQQNFTITTIGGMSGGSYVTNSSHLSLEFDFSSPLKSSQRKDGTIPIGQDTNFPGLGYRLYYQNTLLEKAAYNSNLTKEQIENISRQFKGWWEFVNFRRGSNYTNCPIRLSNSQTDVGTGQVWFENGFYIGTFQEPKQNRRIKITTGVKIPTDDKKVIKIVKPKVGDRVLNTDPDPTDTNPNLLENKSYAGWIYTKVGWKPYGKIEM